MDCKETKRIDSVPDVKGDIKFNFSKYNKKGTKIEEGTMIEKDTCIGLYARNINMVYQKYLYFTDINYMNIFSNLSQIGKIAN